MAKQKFDGMVESVRYAPDGKVLWVRAFMRRGASFTDHVLVQRQELIDSLRSGKSFYAGKRVEQMASTFEVTQPLKLIQKNGQDILTTGENQPDHDRLDGVPSI